MTQPINKHLDFQGIAEIQNALIGTGSAAPTKAKQFQFRNARLEYHDGTAAQSLATLSDLGSSSAFRGTFSAASGALPLAAGATIRPGEAFAPGQFLLVTASGTIVGINNEDSIKAGDLLFLTAADATLAASWTSIERAVDTSVFQVRESVTLASLPANAATKVAPTTVKTIAGYTILDGTTVLNGSFDEALTASGAGIGLSLTSLVAKSNLSVIFSGLTV